jgi:hypothetical protein
MSLEAFEVLGLFIGGVVLPESPEQLQPAFAQAPERAGVGMALVAFGLIVSLGSSAGFAAFIRPQMHGAAQGPVASPADVGLADLPGLIAYGANSGQAHQALSVGKEVPGCADFAEQARS